MENDVILGSPQGGTEVKVSDIIVERDLTTI